ncbi:hypothetical protein Ahia01_000505100, partial [Argonauta hians]
ITTMNALVMTLALSGLIAGLVVYYAGQQSQKDFVDLVVLVSSARENFEERRTIRNTWGQDASSEQLRSRIRVLFVVGDNPCLVPPSDRVEVYSCVPWMPQTGQSASDNLEALTMSTEAKFSVKDRGHFEYNHMLEPQPGSLEMTAAKYPHLKMFLAFRVLHSIIIRKFGLRGSIKADPSMPRIPMVLLDAATQEEVTRVHFSDVDPGITKGSFYYQPVEAFLLPRGFEGTIHIDLPENASISYLGNHDINNEAVYCVPEAGSSVIHFYQNDPNMRCWHQTAVNFIYSVENVEGLRAHMEGRPGRNRSWVEEKNQEEEFLKKEHETFSDLLFVQETDVYRNLPRKMLLAHWAMTQTLRCSYVLKSDDDCFLNLPLIFKHLDRIEHKTFWFGQFRLNWAVDRHGKWADWRYNSVVYPRFACGSGNVVSADISRWLAQRADRADHMQVFYQGEDVTMGIWLSAAVGPVTLDDRRWQCTKTCSPDMYSMPDLTREDLLGMWHNKVKCGDPCGCLVR